MNSGNQMLVMGLIGGLGLGVAVIAPLFNSRREVMSGVPRQAIMVNYANSWHANCGDRLTATRNKEGSITMDEFSLMCEVVVDFSHVPKDVRSVVDKACFVSTGFHSDVSSSRMQAATQDYLRIVVNPVIKNQVILFECQP